MIAAYLIQDKIERIIVGNYTRIQLVTVNVDLSITKTRYTKVKVIIISLNISLLHVYIFCSLGLINSSAIEVDLSYMHNLIETISAGMFSAASGPVRSSNLSYNSIHTIEADAFQVTRQNFFLNLC